MAFRASETFLSAAGLGEDAEARQYRRDTVVPNEVAAALGETTLVYDDGADEPKPKPRKRAAKATADDAVSED